MVAPSDENEPNAPFFVKALGYSLSAVVVLAMACSAGFVWMRHGASMAADMFSSSGRLSPLVIAAFLGPAVALIVVGKWMQWRVDRLKKPVKENRLAATPKRMTQTTNLNLEQAADRLVDSVTKNADPLRKAVLLLADKDEAVADGLSRILKASETVARLSADDRT